MHMDGYRSYRNSEHVAYNDITQYRKDIGIAAYDKYGVWFVSGIHLFNKEQRLLNRKLGLNKVNMSGKKMSRYEKLQKRFIIRIHPPNDNNSYKWYYKLRSLWEKDKLVTVTESSNPNFDNHYSYPACESSGTLFISKDDASIVN